MKRIIMYHDDADGRCAAAITGRYDHCNFNEPSAPSIPEYCQFFPMMPGDPLPCEILDNFEKDSDEFWLLDFSLSVTEMTLIRGEVGANFMWIDHHITAIEQLKHFEGLKGVRNPKTAACMLTWKYCYPDSRFIPMPIRFIADRDMWRFEYGDDTRYFYELFCRENTEPMSPIWNSFLSGASFLSYLQTGKNLYEARIHALNEYAKKLGMEETIRIDGRDFRCLKINYPGSGDMGHVIKDLGYDIAHCYVEQTKDGKPVRIHNLYSNVADVGLLAEQMGGGGHRGAAEWMEEVL
jgi:oligoribonuclease NrnB/cAMP/cGMP phosphodiesterase (DHH superfamily)